MAGRQGSSCWEAAQNARGARQTKRIKHSLRSGLHQQRSSPTIRMMLLCLVRDLWIDGRRLADTREKNGGFVAKQRRQV